MGTGGEDSSSDNMAAIKSTPGKVWGYVCCNTPNKKHHPTSIATETMHRITRTLSLLLHWWSLQQKPPRITFPLDGKHFQSTRSFPQQLLKSRWTEKARAIEMITAKVSESRPQYWLTKRRWFHLWASNPDTQGLCSSSQIAPARQSFCPLNCVTYLDTIPGGCIIMCWSNVESNSPRSEQQLLSPRTLPESCMGVCQQMN